MKLSTPEKTLAVALVVYIALDILLTPVARLETRPVAQVTTVGFVSLGLLFVGFALAIISLVLLFRRASRTAAIVARVAAMLYLPAVLAEQTGNFSSLRPPATIEVIELVQVVIALGLIGASIWIRREAPGAGSDSRADCRQLSVRRSLKGRLRSWSALGESERCLGTPRCDEPRQVHRRCFRKAAAL